MNAINKQGFKKLLGQIAHVSNNFSLDIFQDVHFQERIPVVKVCLSNNKAYDLPFIVDLSMKFESNKPANPVMSTFCCPGKHIMTVDMPNES
jgi:hypothetical protein